MTRDYWWALVTLIIAIALAFILLSTAKDDGRSETFPPPEPSAYDRKLNRLDRQGVESAYRGRVHLLFTNWMTDTNEASAQRVLKGHRNARKIYIEAMTSLDARDPNPDEP